MREDENSAPFHSFPEPPPRCAPPEADSSGCPGFVPGAVRATARAGPGEPRASRRQLSAPRQLRALPPPAASRRWGRGRPGSALWIRGAQGWEEGTEPAERRWGCRLPPRPGAPAVTASPAPAGPPRRPPPCSRPGALGSVRSLSAAVWEAPSRAPRAQGGPRTGAAGSAARAHPQARGDPRPTPSPRGATGPGREGPPGPGTLHIRPGLRYLGSSQAAPSLVSAGDPGGGPGREPAGEGALAPNTQIWLEKGSDIPVGRRGGSARGLYKT